MKSLPLAYNRDLQEDKESLFDVVDTARESLDALKTFLAEAEFDGVRMRRSAETGLMTATDLADLLTTQGIPFREAHASVRQIAERADGDETRFLEFAQTLISKKVKGSAINASEYLSKERSIARRNIEGGTGSVSVERQIIRAKKVMRNSKALLARMQNDLSMVDKLLA